MRSAGVASYQASGANVAPPSPRDSSPPPRRSSRLKGDLDLDVGGVSYGPSPFAARTLLPASRSAAKPVGFTSSADCKSSEPASPSRCQGSPSDMRLSRSSGMLHGLALPQYYQVRPPEMMIPAFGASTDADRVKNNGKALHSRTAGALSLSASTPAFGQTRSNQSARTKRTISQAHIHYPDLNPLSLTGRKPSPPPKIEVPVPKQKPRNEVTWQDIPAPEGDLANLTTSMSPEGQPSVAIQKTVKLLAGLHTLRRTNCKEPAANTAETSPSLEKTLEELEEDPDAADEDEAPKKSATVTKEEHVDDLLHATLRDVTDCEAELLKKAAVINETKELIKTCGGARHATQIISGRIVQVIERKASLLKIVEPRLASFEAAQARCEDILAAIVAGNSELPPELMGIKKFITSYVHTPGEPVEANMSDFSSFVTSFKLPSKHHSLERFRKCSAEYGEWWARATARTASAGALGPAIVTLIYLAVEVGASMDHPMLERAKVILTDRVADKALSDTQELRDKDTMAAQQAEARGKVPDVGKASDFADKIEVIIGQAKAEGVKADDHRLQEALEIAKKLREEDGLRKRMANRQKTLDSKKP